MSLSGPHIERLPKALQPLCQALAGLYPRDPDQRRLVRDAGLNEAEIAWDAKPINTWGAILAEAHAKAMVEAVIDEPVRDYEHVSGLREAVETYRIWARVAGGPGTSDGSAAFFVVPYERKEENFVGRKPDLEALRAAFQAGHPVGLTGMGGVGKTRLAVEYAYSHRNAYPGGIFWPDADKPLIERFAQVGRMLDPDTAAHLIDVQIKAAKDHLRAHPEALLVLDNVADPAELRRPVIQDLIPAGLQCHLLFTTRQRDLHGFTPVEVTVLLPEPALKLLLRARSAALDPAHPEHGIAKEIVAVLGYLPLALEIAGAHLGKMAGRSIAAYRDELLKRGALPVVDDARGGVRDEDLGTLHAAAVEATLGSQWDVLESEDARLLLRVAGQMPEAAAIPAERLGLLAGVSAGDGGFFAAPLDAGLRTLHDASLVEELAEGQARLHPLVREFAERLTPAAEAAAFRGECAARLAAAFADFARLEDQCARRGVDALEGDLLAALAFARDPADAPPGPALRGLLRVLQRESHVLRGWDAADNPALFAQRMHKCAAQMGMKGLAVSAAARLAILGKPHFIWRLQAGGDSPELERRLAGHSDVVNAVAVTLDGRRALSASADTTLIVWNLATGRAERTLEGHSSAVTAVAVTLDGRRALSASADTTLIVWDLATGRAERTPAGHSAWVTAVAVTPDGRRVLSASADTTLIVWNLATGQAERTLAGHSSAVTAVAVTPDGRRALSASWDQTLIVWDLATGQAERTLAGHSHRVTAVAVTPDGRRALSASYDNTVIVWDLATGQAERTLAGHSDRVTAVAVTPDGRRALSASYDNSVIVWDLATGQAERTLAGHSDRVTAVAVTADGRRALSASSDQTLIVWDLATRRAERTLAGHSSAVTAVAVTADGRRALSASADTTLIVWNLATGQAERILAGHSAWVTAVAVTPDGRRALSASRDKTLIVWDLATGQAERTLAGHSDGVTAVAVTPDGRRALSASDDQTLIVWDLATGQAERTLAGHSDGVTAVAVTPDGRRALSGAWTGR